MIPTEPGAGAPAYGWPVFSTGMFAAHGTPSGIGRPLIRTATARPASKPAQRLDLQPIHTLADGRLRGADAVFRRATGAIVAWPDWTPGAAWLLYAACREAWLCNAQLGASQLMIGLTLPAGVACDADLVEYAATAIGCASLPPGLLEIGLSEAALDGAGPDALLALSALRDLGLRVALDQAGVLPASLARLRRLPLTGVRLHPAMPAHLPHSRDARMAVTQAVAAAHAIEATVLATGVSTPLQRDILADLGCDAAQGPFFAPPMPADAFRDTLVGLP